MSKKKWIAYGVTGIVGLGLIAGGAAAAAQSMDLRTIDDERISSGTLNGTLSTDQPLVDPSPSVDPSAPTAVTPPTATSAPSATTQPSPTTQPSQPSPVSPPSPVSVDSAASN